MTTAFNTYCLGGPIDMEKCRTCQHQDNWNTLNQMPDALRKKIQKDMKSVPIDKCRLTKASFYIQKA